MEFLKDGDDKPIFCEFREFEFMVRVLRFLPFKKDVYRKSTRRNIMANAATDTVIHLNSESFDKALHSGQPVLVDFWAEWCGPCRMIGPVIEGLAHEYAGRAIMAKVNVDDNPELAGRYGISSIPNVKIFKNSVEVENIVGAVPAE